MKKKQLFKIGIIFCLMVFVLFLLTLKTASADYYNTTNITNANNLFEQTKALNDIVDGFIGYGFLIVAVFITFVIISGNFDVIAGLGAAGFVGALSSTLLVPLNLIPFHIYQIVILIFGLIMLITFLLKR